MDLLLDENISWRLRKLLLEEFGKILHVKDSPLMPPAQDQAIWQFAKKEKFVIVTRDEDFYQLSMKYGHPPKIILIRSHNKSVSHIANSFLLNKDSIEKFYANPDLGILELF